MLKLEYRINSKFMNIETDNQNEQHANWHPPDTSRSDDKASYRDYHPQPLQMSTEAARNWIASSDHQSEGEFSGFDIHPDLAGIKLNYTAGTKGNETRVLVYMDMRTPTPKEVQEKAPWSGYLVERGEHVFENINAARVYFQNKANELSNRKVTRS
jgi:hypothetical protein